MNCSASPYMRINFFSEEVKKYFFILASAEAEGEKI